MLQTLLASLLLTAVQPSISSVYLFSEKLLGARSASILRSFSECEIQQDLPEGNALLCQTTAFGERIGISFLFNQSKDVAMISGTVAVENDLQKIANFLRPALAAMSASFPGQQEKRTPTGKEWFFAGTSGSVAIVELKKTNVKQWAVSFIISAKAEEGPKER